MGDQVVSGFSLASNWLRERREFSGSITKRSRVTPKKSRITSTFNWKNALSRYKKLILKKELFMLDPTLKQLNDNILMNFLMERLKYFVMINKCSRFLCK